MDKGDDFDEKMTVPKDEDLVHIMPDINSLIEKTKKDIATGKTNQQKKEKEDKALAEDAQYAFTPKKAFDWDAVNGSIEDVI